MSLQELWDTLTGFFAKAEAAGFGHRPKSHLWCHIVADSWWFGNPELYSAFGEESANKVLKAVCQNCHAMQFESTALHRMAVILPKRKL